MASITAAMANHPPRTRVRPSLTKRRTSRRECRQRSRLDVKNPEAFRTGFFGAQHQSPRIWRPVREAVIHLTARRQQPQVRTIGGDRCHAAGAHTAPVVVLTEAECDALPAAVAAAATLPAWRACRVGPALALRQE
jgi:hypothetical protein